MAHLSLRDPRALEERGAAEAKEYVRRKRRHRNDWWKATNREPAAAVH